MARVTETDKKQDAAKPPSDGEKTAKTLKLGGLLGGLGSFIEKLGELAEAGEELSRSGEFQDQSGKVRGVYGINVRTGLGRDGQTELKVEPFGHVRRPAADQPPDEDVREPLLDVHEEEDHVLVLVELPGVTAENVDLKLSDGRLDLHAQRGKTTYHKQIELPRGCSAAKMSWDCNNGILKIRFGR